MHVLDGEHDRHLLARSHAQPPKRLEHARLQRVGIGRLGGGVARDAEDAQEIVDGAVGRPARPVEAALDLLLDDVGRVRLLHARRRAGQLDHRTIGDGAAVGDAVGLEARGRLRRDHAAELVQEPRLADAGGARDADRLSPAARGRVEAAAQQLQLLLVVHERDDTPAEAQPRADVAAEHEVRARLVHLPEVEPALEERSRRLAHEDRLRRAEREQPVEHRDRLVPRVDVDLLPLRAVSDERLHHMDCRLEARRHPADLAAALERLLHGQRRVAAARRRVLGEAEAERCEQSRRRKSLETAAEARDLLDERLERAAGVQHLVALADELDPGAQERHPAALPAQRRAGRRPRRRHGGGGPGSRRRARRGRRRRLVPTQPVLLDARPQRVTRDPEQRRRARDIPRRPPQHLDQPVANRVVEGRARLLHRRRGLGRMRLWQAQRGSGDLALGVEQRQAFHEIGQLTHVARPRVAQQRGARLLAQTALADAIVRARPLEEVIGQLHDVRAALAQRRQRQRDDGESVIEILAEAAPANRLAEVLVGRRDEPHVDGLVARAAEPAHHALLERLEELGLERLAEQPDLVEEDRPALGGLQETRLRAARVGEGAPLEAEHLGLEQRLGDRRAVDVDERPVGARPGAMQHAREQPLARARLALDQDRRQPMRLALALEQAYDALAEGLDLRAVADQIAERAVHRGHHTAAGRAVQPTVQDLTTHSLTTGQRSATC